MFNKIELFIPLYLFLDKNIIYKWLVTYVFLLSVNLNFVCLLLLFIFLFLEVPSYYVWDFMYRLNARELNTLLGPNPKTLVGKIDFLIT